MFYYYALDGGCLPFESAAKSGEIRSVDVCAARFHGYIVVDLDDTYMYVVLNGASEEVRKLRKSDAEQLTNPAQCWECGAPKGLHLCI